MNNISYPKAIASSLPFIGPVFSFLSLREGREAIKQIMGPGCTLENSTTEIGNLRKARIYAICGIASNLLSIGALVGLHAFGLIPGPSYLFPISVTVYSVSSLYSIIFFTFTNKLLKDMDEYAKKAQQEEDNTRLQGWNQLTNEGLQQMQQRSATILKNTQSKIARTKQHIQEQQQAQTELNTNPQLNPAEKQRLTYLAKICLPDNLQELERLERLEQNQEKALIEINAILEARTVGTTN